MYNFRVAYYYFVIKWKRRLWQKINIAILFIPLQAFHESYVALRFLWIKWLGRRVVFSDVILKEPDWNSCVSWVGFPMNFSMGRVTRNSYDRKFSVYRRCGGRGGAETVVSDQVSFRLIRFVSECAEDILRRKHRDVGRRRRWGWRRVIVKLADHWRYRRRWHRSVVQNRW